MRNPVAWFVGAVLLAGPVVSGSAALGQYDRGGYYNGYRGTQPYNDRYDRGRYRDDYDRHRGGIGPGKGALIGAGGGALLGGLFGGAKGALIGGGIGAGGGALVGKANADRRHDRDYRDRYDRYGNPY